MVVALIAGDDTPARPRAARVPGAVDHAVLHALGPDVAEIDGFRVAAELSGEVLAADAEEGLVGAGDGVLGVVCSRA